jgi:hypothetical protein
MQRIHPDECASVLAEPLRDRRYVTDVASTPILLAADGVQIGRDPESASSMKAGFRRRAPGRHDDQALRAAAPLVPGAKHDP